MRRHSLECIQRLTQPEDRCEAMLMLGERHLLRGKRLRRRPSRVAELANVSSNRSLAARATLGLGDLHIQGDLGQAAELYQQACAQPMRSGCSNVC